MYCHDCEGLTIYYLFLLVELRETSMQKINTLSSSVKRQNSFRISRGFRWSPGFRKLGKESN